MTRDELWGIYVSKNPSFGKDGNITLSTNGLKRLFEQTWDLAYGEGAKQARGGISRHHEGVPDPTSHGQNPMNIFKDIFNKKG